MEITAEQMDAIRDAAEALNEIFENLKEKLRELVKKIVDVLTPYLQKVMRTVKLTKVFKCKKCGCIFEAGSSEYKGTPQIGVMQGLACYECECPTCGNPVYAN